jgi:hypothetical protein
MLDAVMPHAGTDDTLPVLMAVRFEVRAGALYVVATNQFTLGAARYVLPAETPVPDAEVLLRGEDADELRELLDHAGETAALVLADGLRIDAGEDCLAGWEDPRGAHPMGWNYPDWQNVLTGLLAADEAPLIPDYGIEPDLLAKFGGDPESDFPETRCAEPLMARPVRFVRPVPGASAVLLARGDWFLGALALIRNVDGLPVDGTPWELWSAALSPQPVPASAA